MQDRRRCWGWWTLRAKTVTGGKFMPEQSGIKTRHQMCRLAVESALLCTSIYNVLRSTQDICPQDGNFLFLYHSCVHGMIGSHARILNNKHYPVLKPAWSQVGFSLMKKRIQSEKKRNPSRNTWKQMKREEVITHKPKLHMIKKKETNGGNTRNKKYT